MLLFGCACGSFFLLVVEVVDHKDRCGFFPIIIPVTNQNQKIYKQNEPTKSERCESLSNSFKKERVACLGFTTETSWLLSTAQKDEEK
jgi:hypothetical protein